MTHFLQRTALIALASGALGACSTDEALRPSYPTRMPEANPPPAAPSPPAQAAPASPPAPSEAPVTAAPPAPVEEHPLAPLPPPPAAAPTPPAKPAPAASPRPTYRTVTTRSVTGRVVEVEGRTTTYRVRKGDTLEEIADKLGTSVAQLREDNHLRKRAVIRPGQILKGPRTRGRAYVVESGDTLYSIARRFGVTADALRDENGLRREASLHAGEKLRLPDGYRDHGPLVTATRVPVSPGAGPAPAAGEASPPGEDAAPPESSSAPAPASAAQASPTPAYRTVTTRAATGRVVEVEGRASTHRVRKGDTLDEIADKLGTSVAQLREDNHLRKRAKIHPGQILKGPRTRGRAYVAESGDSLSEVARRFGVSAEALRAENGLRRGAGVHAGDKLRLPEGARDHGPLVSTIRVPIGPAPAATTAATPPPAAYSPPPSSYSPPLRAYAPPPRTYAPPAAASPSAPAPSPTPADSQVSELGRGRFIWPLQGPVVSDFGLKPTGQRNDGINIGADVGASVRAAAAGDVVYAGDQVPGFGNLVLIKHADGWVTAYGYLSRVLVKMQQKVTQGEEIGLAGATGGVAEPQLHFEIRYAPSPLERAKPIDPKLVLPK